MRVAFAVIAVGLLTGCASYTEQTRDARQALTAGEHERAIASLNEQLDVEELDEPPANLDDEKALLLLERATLLQALGRYDAASRDMIAVDDRFEWLDLGRDTADNILRYLYTDDAGPYRAPPHERLLLNTMNMINFMARGHYQSARVEARRFNLLQTHFLDDDSAKLIPDILGLGNYLAAAAFEASRSYDTAARYYTLAHIYGTWPEGDDDRLLDLITMTGYRGGGLGDLREDADDLLERAGERPRIDRRTYRQTHQSGDTLVVIQTGIAPYREARRISLTEALHRSRRSPYASIHIDAGTSQQAMALYSQGLVTWLNTTELSRQGLPSRRSARLNVDDRRIRLQNPVDIGSQIEQAWDAVSSTALAAAISRAVVRAAAGQTTRLIVREAARQSEATEQFAGILGWLSGLFLQASLAATDTPDTRSWTSLPDDIHLVRLQLPEGPRQLDVDIGSRRDQQQIDVNADRFQLVNFSRLR